MIENDKVIIQYSSLLKERSIYVSIYQEVIPNNEDLIKIINNEKMIYIK